MPNEDQVEDSVETEEVTLSPSEELKVANEAAKAIREKQSALREKVNAGKEERKEHRKVMAQCRKDSQEHKAELRAVIANHYETLSKGEPSEIEMLATQITDVAGKLAETTNQFAKAATALSEL